jgi:hypothetical protein
VGFLAMRLVGLFSVAVTMGAVLILSKRHVRNGPQPSEPLGRCRTRADMPEP